MMTPAGAETYIRSASIRLQSADSILAQTVGLEYAHSRPYLMAAADLTYGAVISQLNLDIIREVQTLLQP